jgi:hypothetical protein
VVVPMQAMAALVGVDFRSRKFLIADGLVNVMASRGPKLKSAG